MVAITPVPGSVRRPVGAVAARRAPNNVAAAAVNWMCDPMAIAQKWSPSAGDLLRVCQEGLQVLAVLRDAPAHAVHAAGAPGQALPDLDGVLAVQGAQAPAPAPAAPAGPPAALPPAAAVAPASDQALEELRRVVESLKPDGASQKKGSKKDKKSKKKKDKAKKKKKKHKKGSSPISGSSSSSRSRSRSRSSSSSGSSDSWVRWRWRGKDRKVSAGSIARLDAEKFKQGRSALLAFAQQHPGALTAHFVNACRQKMRGAAGCVTRTRELRELDLSQWVSSGASGLTETRDLRELYTLASVFDAVQKRDAERALDVLVMRVQALQRAKAKGGSWEKASRIELIAEAGAEMSATGVAGIAS